MSYDDYVRHIAQKYRLAISIGVITSKPENISLEEYIQQLRNSINDDKMDADELNISICSDDFQIDQIDLLTCNIDENNGHIASNNIFSAVLDSHHKADQQIEINHLEIINTQNLNDLDIDIDHSNNKFPNNQSTNKINNELCNRNETNDVEMNNTQYLNDSLPILHFNEIHAETSELHVEKERNSLNDVMEILKGIDNNMETIDMEVSCKRASQATNNEIVQRRAFSEIDLTQYFTGNDKVVCQNVDILPNISKRFRSDCSNSFNNNNYQCSNLTDGQAKTNTYTKSSIGAIENNTNNEKPQSTPNKQQNDVSKYRTESKSNLQRNHLNIHKSEDKPGNIIKEHRHTNNFKNIYQNVAHIFNTNKNSTASDHIKGKTQLPINRNEGSSKILDSFVNLTEAIDPKNNNLNNLTETPKDSQETMMYSIPEDFPCTSVTHYSESQINEVFIIDEKYIRGTNKNQKQNLKEFTQKDESSQSINEKVTNERYIFGKESQKNTLMLLELDNQILENNKNDKNENYLSRHYIHGAKQYKPQAINTDNEVYSQELQLTNCFNSMDNNQTCYQTDKCTSKEISISKDYIHNNNDTPNNKNERSVVEYIDKCVLSTESHLVDNNNIHAAKKYKPQAINTDNEVFSQESQFRKRTNFINSVDSNQTCDQTNKYNSKEISINKDYIHNNNIDIPNNKKERCIGQYADTCDFSKESHLTDNNGQDLTENSTIFSQNAQNMDDLLQTQSDNGNMRDIPSSKGCIVFNKNSKHKFNITGRSRDTKFDENLENTQTTNNLSQQTFNNYNKENVNRREDQNEFVDSNSYQDGVADSMQMDLKKFDGIPNMLVEERCANFDENLVHMEVQDEILDSQREIIPFKIIEELNKVKVYLNRRNDKKFSVEGYSSDTGYRSDSQSRNSLKMSSSSGWINQSAFSLLNYITECPLVVTTQKITREISLVLGQLINRLHEDEQYPSFLEELLETVRYMLTNIYEGDNEEHVLMKKDETVQRIFLLNKSIHIQKYTIEKITCILESLHTALSAKDSLYEIENIDRMENLCYVFHTLEVILQRHNKSENLSENTQNTQNSQDEKVMKKSNITDIWRKKWNPNYVNNENEGSQEKKCITSKCCTVLNKLIVDCMDGYSLISYYALKCFNIMQS